MPPQFTEKFSKSIFYREYRMHVNKIKQSVQNLKTTFQNITAFLFCFLLSIILITFLLRYQENLRLKDGFKKASLKKHMKIKLKYHKEQFLLPYTLLTLNQRALAS